MRGQFNRFNASDLYQSSVLTSAAPTARLWTPDDAPAGSMWARYKPSHPNGLVVSGGLIDQVNDLSGNRRHLTQTGALRIPVGTMNGRDCFAPTGSQYMDCTIPVGSIDNTGAVLVVWDPNNSIPGEVPYVVGVSGGVYPNAAHLITIVSSNFLVAGDDAHGFDLFVSAPYTGLQVVGYIQNLATATLYETGTAIDTGGAMSGRATSNLIRIGAYTDLSLKANSPFGEIIHLAGDVPLALYQKFEAYLAWDEDGGVAGTAVGRLPGGHPYKSAPPMATSSATASGAALNLLGDIAVAFFFEDFTSSGGTTYYINIQAISTPVPSVAKTNTRRLQSICTPTPAMQRTLSRSIQAITTPVPSRRSTVSKALQASSTAVASVARTIERRIQAQTTPAAAVQKVTSKSFQAITTPLGSVGRIVSKSFQAVTTPVASAVKNFAKAIQAITTPTPSESHGAQRNVSVQAITTPTPSVRKTASRQAQAVTTPAPSFSKVVTRVLQAVTTPVPRVGRTVSLSRQAVTTPAPSVRRTLSKALQAITTPLATAIGIKSKIVNVQAVTTPVPSVARTVALNRQASTTPVPSVRRTVSKVLIATAGTVASLSKVISRRLQASTQPQASVSRLISKRLQAVTTPIANLTKTIIGPAVAYTRRIFRILFNPPPS